MTVSSEEEEEEEEEGEPYKTLVACMVGCSGKCQEKAAERQFPACCAEAKVILLPRRERECVYNRISKTEDVHAWNIKHVANG